MEENKPIENPSPPLALNMDVNLKVYAIAAIKKDLWDKEMMATIKDKLIITMLMAYTDSEAMLGVAHGIVNLGFDPNLYVIPSAFVKKEVKEIIESTQQVVTFFPGLPVTPAIVVKEEEAKEKSNTDMIAYIRFVFDLCGTQAQKKTAEVVIKKFQEHAKSIGIK